MCDLSLAAAACAAALAGDGPALFRTHGRKPPPAAAATTTHRALSACSRHNDLGLLLLVTFLVFRKHSAWDMPTVF